jgi:ketosteroid isomerase-like protein
VLFGHGFGTSIGSPEAIVSVIAANPHGLMALWMSKKEPGAMSEASTIAVRDVVLGMWQALSRRDWDAVKTFLSADCLYVDMPIPALSARGQDDIVKRLKILVDRLAGYEGHDGVLVSNGSDVMYEHSETGRSHRERKVRSDSSPSTRSSTGKSRSGKTIGTWPPS